MYSDDLQTLMDKMALSYFIFWNDSCEKAFVLWQIIQYDLFMIEKVAEYSMLNKYGRVGDLLSIFVERFILFCFVFDWMQVKIAVVNK